MSRHNSDDETMVIDPILEDYLLTEPSRATVTKVVERAIDNRFPTLMRHLPERQRIATQHAFSATVTTRSRRARVSIACPLPVGKRGSWPNDCA